MEAAQGGPQRSSRFVGRMSNASILIARTVPVCTCLRRHAFTAVCRCPHVSPQASAAASVSDFGALPGSVLAAFDIDGNEMDAGEEWGPSGELAAATLVPPMTLLQMRPLRLGCCIADSRCGAVTHRVCPSHALRLPACLQTERAKSLAHGGGRRCSSAPSCGVNGWLKRSACVQASRWLP